MLKNRNRNDIFFSRFLNRLTEILICSHRSRKTRMLPAKENRFICSTRPKTRMLATTSASWTTPSRERATTTYQINATKTTTKTPPTWNPSSHETNPSLLNLHLHRSCLTGSYIFLVIPTPLIVLFSKKHHLCVSSIFCCLFSRCGEPTLLLEQSCRRSVRRLPSATTYSADFINTTFTILAGPIDKGYDWWDTDS